MKSSPVLLENKAAIHDAGPFEKMVSFEISSSELEQAMNRAARRISREVNIPGFRPGRAPRRLVERRVGADRVRSDALDELVPARMEEILTQTEIFPAVPPLLESTTDGPGGSVKLEVRVTTWPRLESVPDYRGRRILIEPLSPITEVVNTRLESLRHMYAPLQTVERPAQNGDFVVIDMTVTDGERLIEALALDSFSYEVGSVRLTAEIDEELMGRRAGDEIEIEAPLPGWLGAQDPPSGAEGDESQTMGMYRIRVVEVQSRSLPELDDEWASEYTGHDSLDDLREEMSDELEEERNSTQWSALVSETIKEAVSELELDLPKRLASAQTEALFRNHLVSLEQAKLDYPTYLERTGLEHEQFIEELRERSVIGLKTRILTETVIEGQGIVVGDSEALEFLDWLADEAQDPESARRQIDQGVNLDQLKGEMLTARAHAFLAMQVQPVDDQGEPVPVRPPDRVKAWFEPRHTEENPDGGTNDPEPLYEAEVIG